MIRKALTTLAVLATALIYAGNSAQAQTNVPTPDCVIFINLGGTANTAVYDNRFNGCVSFTLTYGASGFSGVTLTFQYATLAAPTSFLTYPGSVTTGINPNTSTTGATSIFSNGATATPWLRVAFPGVGGGILQGVVSGYKTGDGGGGGGGGGCPGTTGTPCVVVGPAGNGVALAGAPVRVGISD